VAKKNFFLEYKITMLILQLFYLFISSSKILNDLTSYNINSGFDMTKNDTIKFNFKELNYKYKLLKTIENKNVNINHKLDLIKYNNINIENIKSINITSGGLFKDWN
jgi:hypothetical protein